MTRSAATGPRMSRAVLGLAVVAWLGLQMPSALADIEGPCIGRATIDGVTYDASYDTADNPIRLPEKPSGLEIPYVGSITAANTNYSGQIGVVVGPAVVPVATWGTEPNPDDERVKDGIYLLGDDIDNLVGIYEVEAFHKVGDTEVCTASAVVKIEGSPLQTPVGLAAVLGAAVFGISTLLALIQKRPGERGRPVFGGIMGLLFGIFLAVVLQQYSFRPLDNLSVIGLPLVFAAVGVGFGLWGPFGGGTVSPAKL